MSFRGSYPTRAVSRPSVRSKLEGTHGSPRLSADGSDAAWYGRSANGWSSDGRTADADAAADSPRNIEGRSGRGVRGTRRRRVLRAPVRCRHRKQGRGRRAFGQQREERRRGRRRACCPRSRRSRDGSRRSRASAIPIARFAASATAVFDSIGSPCARYHPPVSEPATETSPSRRDSASRACSLSKNTKQGRPSGGDIVTEPGAVRCRNLSVRRAISSYDATGAVSLYAGIEYIVRFDRGRA